METKPASENERSRQASAAAGQNRNPVAGPQDEFALLPVKAGRELVKVSRQGVRCYRLEKIKCGKKNCRCTRGELHGPYWYAYYRKNGRMRCEYVGKTLPHHATFENRARQARKNSRALRQTSAAAVAQLKNTLNKSRSLRRQLTTANPRQDQG